MILQENGAERNRGITLASIKGIIGNVVLVISQLETFIYLRIHSTTECPF